MLKKKKILWNFYLFKNGKMIEKVEPKLVISRLVEAVKKLMPPAGRDAF